MIRLSGRLLSRPVLLYKKKILVQGQSWNLADERFRTPVELSNWACLRIVQNSDVDKSIHVRPCSEQLETFQSHLRSKHITVKTNSDYHDDLRIWGKEDYKRLDGWFEECQKYRVTFLIVLLPDRVTSELYNHIKRYGDVKHGIHTVCVKAAKLGTARYDENVALVSAGTFLF